MLGCSQHNTEIIILIDVEQRRLHLPVSSLRKHIEEIREKMI